jgi:hypothetical protein
MVEFPYGGQRYFFAPKEVRTVEKQMGEFILNRARVGLVEYKEAVGRAEAFSESNYSAMPWRELVALGSARGVYKPGSTMKKAELIKLMEEYDSQGGTLPNTSN